MDFLSKRETTRSLPQCQQEADGHLLAHDTHAIDEGHEGVVVYSEDTDVFMIVIYKGIDHAIIQEPEWYDNIKSFRDLV